jgi:hypothetical protein
MRLIATVDQRINQEVRAERLNAATYRSGASKAPVLRSVRPMVTEGPGT